MNKTIIDDFTDRIMEKEKFFAFFIWKKGKQYGANLSNDDVKDILSDSYLKAVTKLTRQGLELNYPLAWFSRIVFLTLMNHIRKEMRRSNVIDPEAIENVEMANFIYETIDQNQTDGSLKKIIEQDLSKEERTVLQMEIEGYTYEEISAAIGKSNAAVRQMTSRLRNKLKKRLN